MKNGMGIAVVVVSLIAVLLAGVAFTSSRRDAAWEYADLRVTSSLVDGRQFIVISCEAIGLSAGGEVKSRADFDRYNKEAMTKIGGTGKTPQDQMGSLGWELVSTSLYDAKGSASPFGFPENTFYYFKRRK